MNQWSDEQLMQLYFDGKLPAEDIPEVERRICCEPALADKLLKISGDEINLREWEGDSLKYSTGKTGWEEAHKYVSKHPWKTTFSLLGVLICIGGLFSSFYFFKEKSPATLPYSQQVKLLDRHNNQAKERRKQQTITEGTVQLLLPTGVKILITAPATFQVTGKNSILLSQGMLLAEVITEEGKGFTVNTPSSINVDLGTVFGIAVDQKGTSVTQVFRGVVTTTNRHLSVSDNGQSSLSNIINLTTNERILHRTDGTSTQGIRNLAELFFVNFDHSNSSNKKGMQNRIAELIGIDKITAKKLREQQEKKHASMAGIASLEKGVSLSKKSPSNTNATAGFYNSFDNELAIEMGGAIKNAKQGPQHANLTYEDGGVLIKEGSRLSFKTAGHLNNKKGHISFRIKPNWDGATDKQKRAFFRSGPFRIGKWYGGHDKQERPYIFFRFDSTKEIQNTASIDMDNLMTGVLGSWKKGTKHTIEAEWDLTLPLGQQYLMLTVDGLFTKTMMGTWNSAQALPPTFVVGADEYFQRSADALFDEIHIDNKLKGNKKTNK